MRRVRRYVSPRLLIPSSRTRPPVPRCRGTSPNPSGELATGPERAWIAHGRFSPAPRMNTGASGLLHDRCGASPPRLRGITKLATADPGTHRVTPAPARTHLNRALRRQTPPPHPRARGNTDVPLCRFPPTYAISGRVPPLEFDSALPVQAGRISMSPHPKARALPNPCWSRVVNSSTSVNRTIPVRFSMPMVASCPLARRRCRRR